MTTLNGQWKPQLFTSLPNSLREKLVEKYDPINRPITKENFIHEIEDLAGIRLVVCQKGHISKVINRLRSMAEEGLTIERKSSSYCSRHFILASTTEFDSDNLIKYELQVRTILEEAMFENVHRFFFTKKNQSIILLEIHYRC